MDFFRKGSDPPPLLFSEVMEPMGHIWFLVTKKGRKKNFPKTLKMAIF